MLNRPIGTNMNTGGSFGNFGVQPSIPAPSNIMQPPFQQNLNRPIGGLLPNLPPVSGQQTATNLPPISLPNNQSDLMFRNNHLPMPGQNQLPIPSTDNLMSSSNRLNNNNLNGNKRGKQFKYF